jgi:restriction system protein
LCTTFAAPASIARAISERSRLAQEHAEAVRRYEEEQEARNAEVRELRRGYEEGDPEAVERFIEAREVLEELEAGNNLITMDWQDFEMLVRDVFEKVFSDEGTEVNVTRASRDEGVDAVVVNPDPLKGGKTIVQAKRYRKAVPAAAVRELYGAMQSERAGRGILVTTAHYGRSAHEFARDKEITLIDGAGLLHMLQNHGHRVKIDPSEA